MATSSSCPWTRARASNGTPSPATSTAVPKKSTLIPPPAASSASISPRRFRPSSRPRTPSTSSISASAASCSRNSGAAPWNWALSCCSPKAGKSIPTRTFPSWFFRAISVTISSGGACAPRPRIITLKTQHPNPYYDDSYAVNSANVGPYADAITQELIPAVEQKFRGIGQGWARGLYGGSTGGWEALGMQVFYPDFFNGTWCMCPDPVDFRAYQIVNLYDDKNALWTEGPWSRIARPSARTPDDAIITTMDRENRRELVLGTHGRSADQYNVWQAVYSPVGDDGYPKPIWDPLTGVIDHQVAAYWREHYDLRYILERDWKTLGPKLVGKIHVKVGTRDTYYLDNAVRLLEQFLSKTNNPYYAGDFEYGPHLPHCFSAGPHTPLPPATSPR